MQPPKSNSNRIEKVSSLIQREVGRIILPYVEETSALVTVSKVEVSRDLKWAKVWISIIGGNDEKVMQMLNRNIYDIQGELNHELHIKVLPRLQFELDTSPRYAAHINELIDQIHNENPK